MTTQHRTIIINLHQNNSQSLTLTFKFKFYRLYVGMVWTAFNLQKAPPIWFSKSEPKHVETSGLAFAIETMVSIIRSVTSSFGLEIFSLRTIYSSEGVLWQGDGGLVCKFMPCNVTHLWDWCVWLEWGLTDTFTCVRVCAGWLSPRRCALPWRLHVWRCSALTGCWLP